MWGIRPGMVVCLRGATVFHADEPFAVIRRIDGDWALLEIMEGPGTLDPHKARHCFTGSVGRVFEEAYAIDLEEESPDMPLKMEAKNNRKYAVRVDHVIDSLSRSYIKGMVKS